MRAIWKQVTRARTRMLSQAENPKIVMFLLCLDQGFGSGT
jgi:hypothetical protein